jgi:SAM-dependent methyltransferase
MSDPKLINRRRDAYYPLIYKGDYFIIKHLKFFIESRLEKYTCNNYVVADIGCGEQPMRKHIESLGGQYVGIDVTQNSKNNVSIISSITNIPLPENSLDVILCSEVLEHVSNTNEALKELSRLIKKNGKIIVTTPFFYPLHEEPNDFIRLTPYQLKEISSKVNLEVIEIYQTGNELEVLATVWDNMWYRMTLNNSNFVRKLWNGFLRFSINVSIIIGNFFLKDYLPKKAYLNTVCVLTKF